MTIKGNELIKYIIETSDVTPEKKQEALDHLDDIRQGVLLLWEVDARVTDIQFDYEDESEKPLGQRISKFLDKYYVTI